MSTDIKRRLKRLELEKAGRLSREEFQALEDARMAELAEKVKGFYPDEGALWAAMDRLNILESSEKMEDIEEHLETGKFILREISRLQAEAPSKKRESIQPLS